MDLPVARENLPRDVDSLQDLVVELSRRLQERDLHIERLTRELVRLRRWQFGVKSERIPDGQLVFGFAGTPETVVEKPVEEQPFRRRRRPHGHHVIAKDLDQREIVLELPEKERACSGCGTIRILIGFEESRRLDWTPANFVEEILKRAKYACPGCHEGVATAPAPPAYGPIERGLPGPGLLAQVVVSKFADHLPLYRQSAIYRRQGVHLSRSTLCDWVLSAADLLAPIVAEMRRDVLASGIVKTDDTVMRLLVAGRGRTIQARLWGYLGDAFHNQVVYDFTPDRKKEHPEGVLAAYKGFVQSDAYGGYDALYTSGDRIELGCWAHARRYFFEARDTDPERGGIALGFIRSLYQIESEASGRPAADRTALRREKSRPVLDEFRRWLEREGMRLLPKSAMGEAFRYALAQWTALTRYVDVGDADIDNNAMERALRGAVLGRKNFLFVAGRTGGPAAAVAYSVIESCKLNGVDPYRYLKDVLMRVWTHPASRIADLMPRLWSPLRGPP